MNEEYKEKLTCQFEQLRIASEEVEKIRIENILLELQIKKNLPPRHMLLRDAYRIYHMLQKTNSDL